jgi:hypothetical protein
MSAQLEGEEEESPGAGIKLAADPTTPTSSTPTDQPGPLTPVESDDNNDNDDEPEQPKPSVPLCCSSHIWKPSHILQDLQSGAGVTSTQSASPLSVPPVSINKVLDEDKNKANQVWAVVDREPALLKEFEGLVNVFLAETADSEALEPCTIAKAKRRPNWLQWEQAILEELATLKAASTWVLEEAPPGANIIGSKWVFKAKKDTAGFIAHLKACLVAQGFSQIGGVDYDDTYTPVARLASSRAIIAMANCLDLLLHQVNIKGAYLNGELNDNEVLYMHHLPSYKPRDAGNCMLHLKKTLYGLKQSG